MPLNIDITISPFSITCTKQQAFIICITDARSNISHRILCQCPKGVKFITNTTVSLPIDFCFGSINI